MEENSKAVITDLLNRVSQIRVKHELVAELTGENFNIFRILGLQSSENRTHSAFLRELLDPQGTHGMGDAFLKAFIRILRSRFSHLEAFKINQLIEAKPIVAKVVAELHLGFKSEDLTEGGRVDLVITPHGGGWRIFIENKIYAGDQECQLVRYRNGDKGALLLYLTLNGGEASEFSTVIPGDDTKLKAGLDYIPISYGDHILEWLDACMKESSSRPLVRETIVQYINLIRIFTQKSISHKMDQELEKAVTCDAEHFAAAKRISEAYEAIVDRKRIGIQKHLESLGENYVCDWKDFKICTAFGFDGGSPYLMFDVHDQKGKVDQMNPSFDPLKSLLKQMSFKQNRWHIGYKECEYGLNGNIQKFCLLSDEDSVAEVIGERDGFVKRFVAGLDDICA